MADSGLPQPKKPTNISAYAEVCLQAISQEGLGHLLSLGGAFGLLHYWDYRSTHDVDAWWRPESGADERRRVVDVLESALAAHGEVHIRRWGEVVSVELREASRTIFSFQIAERSALLEEPVAVDWTSTPIDSLPDLIASKMNALVERGAPRDFRDIHAICQAGLTTPIQCWDLWRQRQLRAGSDTGLERAQLTVETHLERIEQSRPLERIVDSGQRIDAQEVRSWYRKEFVHVHLD